MRRLALLLFFLSGACALVYEVAWTRALTLALGAASPAVATVLGVFMGGLALGSWGAGRLADRWARPLRAYGFLEMALGLYAAATPFLFEAVLPVFGHLGRGLPMESLGPLRLGLCAALLLPPTVLMGASLPVLARHQALQGGEPGRGAGQLYGWNTAGAFAGTLLAGLVLLPGLGLRATLLATAWFNMAVGGAAVVAGGAPAGTAPEPTPPAPGRALRARHPSGARRAEPGDRCAPSARLRTAVLLAAALAGFAGLALEVIWTRVLVLLAGGSTYALTAVLATFLAGLGLGSLAASSGRDGLGARARDGEEPVSHLLARASPRWWLPRWWLPSGGLPYLACALGAAAAACLTSASFPHLQELVHHLYHAWSFQEAPERILAVQFLLAGVVMLLPATLAGALFPLAARLLAPAAGSAARDVGTLAAWNTVGALLGSAAAGFLLIPWLGIRLALLVAVSLLVLAGATVAMAERPESGRRALVALAVLALAWVATPAWDRTMMTGAAYYYSGYYPPDEYSSFRQVLEETTRILYYRDGVAGTVTVLSDLTQAPPERNLAVNGKFDGSSRSDMPTQRVSAHLPLLLHPDPREVCVIGMGTGCTAGSASLHPVQVHVVEIEPAVVEAACRFFAAENHGVGARENVEIVPGDGRLYLRLHPGAFDVVISEPSNPWQAGNADLFTREFFSLGAESLRPGGIFCQWIHLYGLGPDRVRLVARTFRDVFPYVYVASTLRHADLVLLGSREPIRLDAGRLEERLRGAVAADLASPLVGIRDVPQLLARVRMGPDDAAAWAGAGPLNTDDLPRLAYLAPLDLYRFTSPENMKALNAASRGVAPYLEGNPDRSFLYRLAEAYRDFLGPVGATREEEAALERAASNP